MRKKGGYHQNKFIPNLLVGIENAKNADSNKNYFLPDKGTTKVYQLGEALIEVIGMNDFKKFLKTKLLQLK